MNRGKNTVVPPEIDLRDVLKQRVEAGAPIYITCLLTPALEATIDGLAKDSGKSVKVVQFRAQLDIDQLRNAGAEDADAAFSNAELKIALKTRDRKNLGAAVANPVDSRNQEKD